MTREAQTLLAYLSSRADRNTGRGSVLLADLRLLLFEATRPDRRRDTDDYLREIDNAGSLFDVTQKDGLLWYRVEKD